MKRFLCAIAILLLARDLRAESFTVRVRESVTVEIPGATAAYAIDPSIADVTTPGAGRVSVTGRSAGTTQLIAITATGTKSYLITVAAPRNVARVARPGEEEPAGRYEVRYSSASAQMQNAFDVFIEDGERRSQFHLLNVHYFEETFGRDADAFPSVFYRVTTPSRELTLLDALVDLSPITIRSAQIRGIHLRQQNVELHAGYAASTMYEDLFLPADRRWTAGGSYAIESGSVRWIPSVYAFFSEPDGTAARRGVIGSLTAEHQRGAALFLRGEVGVSRSVAAAADLRYDSERDRVRARAWLKPAGFPTLGLSDTPGLHGEADWNRRVSERLAIDSYAVFDRFDLPDIDQSIGVVNLGLRYALSSSSALLSGGDASIYRIAGRSYRTVAVPLGIAWDSPSFGASATYRVIDHSEATRRGDTLRLSTRAARGGFRASAWAERQRRAPTLDLIFREQPGLEAALLRLGLSVRTPEDVARVLRDNAALVNLGFIDGVTVNLTPERLMGGLDLAWISAGAGRDQLRLHTVFSRDEAIRAARDLLFTTLTYSRRLVAATDLYGSFSWWRTETAAVETEDSAFEVGLRQRFEGLPAFLRRRGTIEGVVFLDPQMRRARGEGTTPLSDIVVTLDGERTTRTDGNGAYLFRDVEPGPHRVAAELPETRPAFFTTPSRVELDGSGRADFGLVWTPARIRGHVTSDAGAGIAGAIISASSDSGAEFSATTDSEGDFVLAVPGGEYRVVFAAESLPPGFSIHGETGQVVIVHPDHPEEVTFEVRALRSVSGTVAGGSAAVTIEPLGRTAPTDAEGNYVFRSLPPGTFTITAERGGRTETRTITLPEAPVVLRDIDLGEPSAIVATAEELPAAGAVHHVQAGAYRVPANAAIARRRLEELGYHPTTKRLAGLDAIMIGPFASRAAAEEQVERLQLERIEAVVLSDRGVRALASLAPESFVVQLGAFRDIDNARAVSQRATRLGHDPFTVAARGLTIVRVGPFGSRTAATAASRRLRQVGIETLIIAGAR